MFDGTNLDAWQTPEGHSARWKVANGELAIVPGSGEIQTKASFGDVQLHIEWAAPEPPTGNGQDRGNSGIFFMGLYELQILDSYRADTYTDGQVAAIYGQYPPLFNASRPPGEWQSLRRRFSVVRVLTVPESWSSRHGSASSTTASSFRTMKRSWARLAGSSGSPIEQHEDRAPIKLQDHGHAVRFRNIWLVNLPERPAPTAQRSSELKPIALDAESLDRYVGGYAGNRDRDTAVFKVIVAETATWF